MDEKRFVKIYSKGSSFAAATEIWVDMATGVEYMWHRDGYAGGLTPLLDENGKPVVYRRHRAAKPEE